MVKKNPNDVNISGSPIKGEPEFVAIGKLRRPHGIHGEMLMSLLTNTPEFLKPGLEAFIGESHRLVHISRIQGHKDNLIISFEEFSDRDEIGLFRNELLWVRTENLPPLSDDEYYLHQVIGMQVIDKENDNVLGIVTDVLETGANEVIVVRNPSGSEYLFPVIDQVIQDFDFNGNSLYVRIIPGLLPDN